MTSSVLETFMGLKSIEPNFIDAWGHSSQVSNENIRNLIAKMGIESVDDDSLMTLYKKEENKYWLSPLPPVSIFQKDTPYTFDLCLPIDSATDTLIYVITLEDGSTQEGTLCATDFPLIGTNEISDLEFQCYQIDLTLNLPFGYHSLSLYDQGIEEPLAIMSLIITPSRCFIPDELENGKKVWGSSVQLYGVKSKTNWGIGDFSDLKYLLTKTHEKGGDFIGLNPIHALYPSQPDNASPYSPSSRIWLNILYTDITAVDEFSRNSILQGKVNSTEFQHTLSTLRDSEWVEYKSVTDLKVSALRALFSTLNDGSGKSNERREAFNQFIEDKGELLIQQAAYDALQVHFQSIDSEAWGWPVWPKDFQSYQSPNVQTWIEDNRQEVDFWCYTQWVAELQISEADRLAKSLGMTLGIYRDLAVGVATGSAAVWANHSIYCEQISIGAPPDVLGPLGQSWGLPPIAPDQLQKTAYKPLIELLRANMQHCGALRIDHVMAFLRLWWVPEGEHADKGAYIYYQVEDMLNLLALESMRNECLIIGEDLGTIPEGIDVLLKDAGVFSYKVFFFEQAHDGGFIAPLDYEKQAMATICTHDMPTIKGFWQSEDLYLGRELGLYPDPDTFKNLLDSRTYAKQQILDSLHGLGSLPSDFPRDARETQMTQTLNFALQTHLAKGSSLLLSLQLEDFLEMDKPVNVPGTSDEYRNWQRKLSQDLDDLFANDSISTLLTDLTTSRRDNT